MVPFIEPFETKNTGTVILNCVYVYLLLHIVFN